MGRRLVGTSEQAHLLLELLAMLRRLYGVPKRREERGAVGFQRVEGARADEGLHRTAVHEPAIHATAEIAQVAERPRGAARRDDRLDRVLAGALHGA